MTKATGASKVLTVTDLPHGRSMAAPRTPSARYVTVTPELVAEGATSGVGFTVAQMLALGEHPRKGWRRRAIGKTITYGAAHTFLFAARRPKNRPLPGSPAYSKALAILERAALPPRRRHSDPLEELVSVASRTACPLCHGEQPAAPGVHATARTIQRDQSQNCQPPRERIVTGPRVVRDIAGNASAPPPWGT
jgi:hypothetical protein